MLLTQADSSHSHLDAMSAVGDAMLSSGRMSEKAPICSGVDAPDEGPAAPEPPPDDSPRPELVEPLRSALVLASGAPSSPEKPDSADAPPPLLRPWAIVWLGLFLGKGSREMGESLNRLWICVLYIEHLDSFTLPNTGILE